MKISIIIPVLNAVGTLPRSLSSISKGSEYDVEVIVIDGASTDGTIELIKSQGSLITHWVSEKDNGIYNAMNKGLRLATGDVIGILNADDAYADGYLARASMALKSSNIDFVYASALFKAKDRDLIVSPVSKHRLKKVSLQKMPMSHPTILAKRVVYEKAGIFNERYRITADQEWLYRVITAGFKGEEIPAIGVIADGGGVSDSWRIHLEYRQVAISHGRGMFLATSIMMLNLFKRLVAKSIYILLPAKMAGILIRNLGGRIKPATKTSSNLP